MYLPYRQFPRAARCRRDCSPRFLLKNSAPKLLCLGAILSLVCAANSSHSDNASITPRDRGVGDFSLASGSSGLQTQIMTAEPRSRINVDGFNRQREKDIANDSRKLLSLAIALKAELDNSPDARLSPDAAGKARKIEKLAHDVKRKMQMAPLHGPI